MRHVPAAAIDSGQQQFIIEQRSGLKQNDPEPDCRSTGALNCDRELSARFCRGGAFRHSICGGVFPTECAATAKARAFVDFFERSFNP
jgi:hypothetical protein